MGFDSTDYLVKSQNRGAENTESEGTAPDHVYSEVLLARLDEQKGKGTDTATKAKSNPLAGDDDPVMYGSPLPTGGSTSQNVGDNRTPTPPTPGNMSGSNTGTGRGLEQVGIPSRTPGQPPRATDVRPMVVGPDNIGTARKLMRPVYTATDGKQAAEVLQMAKDKGVPLLVCISTNGQNTAKAGVQKFEREHHGELVLLEINAGRGPMDRKGQEKATEIAQSIGISVGGNDDEDEGRRPFRPPNRNGLTHITMFDATNTQKVYDKDGLPGGGGRQRKPPTADTVAAALNKVRPQPLPTNTPGLKG